MKLFTDLFWPEDDPAPKPRRKTVVRVPKFWTWITHTAPAQAFIEWAEDNKGFLIALVLIVLITIISLIYEINWTLDHMPKY